MSERYWITGVQLGMIRAFTMKGDKDEIRRVLDVVEGDQFIGHITEGTEIVIEPIVKAKAPPVDEAARRYVEATIANLERLESRHVEDQWPRCPECGGKLTCGINEAVCENCGYVLKVKP